MGKRKGMIYEAVERLDSLMAIGEKRSEAKAKGEMLFAFSDGKMHSYETRSTYQATVMRFLHWCRATYGLKQLADVDARADELASAYLSQRVDEGKSAWTLQAERAALRCFFRSRDLASSVDLPQRRRENIVRSRLPAERDRHIQPDNWQPLIRFLQACGLRREEVRDLRVHDVYQREPGGRLVVRVERGKGGKTRDVPVLPGREPDVHQVVEGRQPDELVFERIPGNLDVHALRREFARELYEYYAGCSLPEGEEALRLAQVDREAVLKVSRALGHNRLDVVITHYLQ